MAATAPCVCVGDRFADLDALHGPRPVQQNARPYQGSDGAPTAGSPAGEASAKKRSVLLALYAEPSAAAPRVRVIGTS